MGQHRSPASYGGSCGRFFFWGGTGYTLPTNQYTPGQIITTSAEVTLNGGLIRELPQNPLNSGLGIILICPDTWPIKHGGWKMNFFLGWPIFRGYVSFEGGYHTSRVPLLRNVLGRLTSANFNCKKVPAISENRIGPEFV